MYKKTFALVAVFALALVLAGCGGNSASSSSSSATAGSESSSSSSSSSSTSSSAAAEYTSGNGTLDCEYVTLEVIGQGEYDGGATLEVSATNKTDHDIHLNPAFEWTVNGEEAYGVLVMNPEPGETTETSIIFTDAKGKTLPYEAITDAAGVIQVQDENFNILDNFDFAYSS